MINGPAEVADAAVVAIHSGDTAELRRFWPSIPRSRRRQGSLRKTWSGEGLAVAGNRAIRIRSGASTAQYQF